MDKEVLVTAEQVLEAFRLWHGGEVSDWPLAHLHLALAVRQNEDTHRTLADSGAAAQNRAILNQGLTILQTQSPDAYELLITRFRERHEVKALAHQMNLTRSAFQYRQREAIKQITEILIRLEMGARSSWREQILSRLEIPSYEQLIGVETLETEMMSALAERNSHFVAAMDGLGGIGKTAMADRLVRLFTETGRFTDIAWVTAKQTHLSTLGRLQVESSRAALTYDSLLDELSKQFTLTNTGQTVRQTHRLVEEYLRDIPCLIVIDNLETVADYRTLLPALHQIKNPSKFLLTSRRRLLDEHYIFSRSLRELPAEAAFELLRFEAQRSGLQELVAATDQQLGLIYEVIGGNPLAIKLVVGQLRLHSLPNVLARLTKRGQDIKSDIFDYIFRDTWDDLSDNSKRTWLALLQAGPWV